MKLLKDRIEPVSNTLLYSYSQIFFAQNKIFGALLLLITFADPWTGLGGLLAVTVSNLLAWLLGFDRDAIRSGSYGFNSLLVGLGLSIYFSPGISFFVLLVIGAVITLLITLALAGFLSKYGLPYLSLPFVLSLWTLMLASRNFEALGLSERGVYILNELFATGSHWLVDMYERSQQVRLPDPILVYFKSLGAIFFQFNLFSGLIIATGLLIFSRIAFFLSLFTFLWAYAFYALLGADISLLSYNYIGFNYILTGIALGGFYLIPSRSSFAGVLLVVPPLVVLTSSLAALFATFQLGVYALPFNLVVLTFLYVLKLRIYKGGLEEVNFQFFHPEKNLYYQLSGNTKFKNFRQVPIGLPFFGQWVVTQAIDGEITHRGAWKDAWDFEIMDEDGKYYQHEGRERKDYYCYEKPVLAPADGEVEEVINSIEDNVIGDSNLSQNWGNSIVVKHGYQLYSQLSHLKPESIKVKKGDRVRKGDILASCGNSGRSPVPHLHFQLMTTPHTGSATLNYPLSSYLSYHQEGTRFHLYDFPENHEVIGSVHTSDQLKYAFNFLPGQVLRFMADTDEQTAWEVKTDYYNRAYLQCLSTGAKAFFVNDGVVFYFTYFYGSRKSLLYYFFLGAYKVVLMNDPNLVVEDMYPLNLLSKSAGRVLINDFLVPLKNNLMTAGYRMERLNADDNFTPTEISWHSFCHLNILGRKFMKYKFEFEVKNYRIVAFTVDFEDKKILLKCADC